MVLSDDISLLSVTSGYDENLDPIETKEWIPLGKCCIVKNGEGGKINTYDGQMYAFNFIIFLKNKKGMTIPKYGDMIHIRKKDGTIDRDCTVIDFVTLKNWIKIWGG